MKRLSLAAVLAAFGIATAAGTASAQQLDLTIAEGATCPSSIASIGRTEGLVIGCSCPSGHEAGSIWGSGPYTGDSDICGAAVHSGFVTGDGGPIWIKIGPAGDGFEGSTANGVTTQNWGSFANTLVILGKGNMDEVAAADCPGDAKSIDGEVTCQCSAESLKGGTVWGSDVYTEDSAICRAALHAGAVDADGGRVTVRTMAGQNAYEGSTKNGVVTLDYGRWGASFGFAK